MGDVPPAATGSRVQDGAVPAPQQAPKRTSALCTSPTARLPWRHLQVPPRLQPFSQMGLGHHGWPQPRTLPGFSFRIRASPGLTIDLRRVQFCP